MVFLLPLCRASAETSREQAQNLEKQGRWFEACCLYDDLLARDRNHPELRDAYRRCLRNFRQQRRLDDIPLQSILTKLSASESGDLYDQVLTLVVKHYADRERLDLTELFQQGLGELRAATQKKSFLQRLQGRATEADLAAFRATLDRWEGEKVPSRAHAGERVRKIVVAGSQLGLPPGVLALELACGAANSLDEYSLYLAPGRVSPAQAAVKNKIVGIGVEMAMVDQKLEISRVYRKSPAADIGLMRGDRITRIDGHELDPLAPDLAAERLLGEAGTTVELEVVRGQLMPQMVKIERQAVAPVSVDFDVREPAMGSYIGYMRIHHFQESTLQEVKDILETWRARALSGIIIDLRGNPGGQFKPALGVAELFLPETVIAYTISPLRDLTRTYKSSNLNPNPLPLVLLVDGETASAAEVLAGALKDNHRAYIIGQTTYGKGSIQCVIPLEKAPGGLRLTVAKFTSPSRVPLHGRGLQPDRINEDPDPDAAIKEAEIFLRNRLMMMMYN
jgi:carboxyl-terminal processing protease